MRRRRYQSGSLFKEKRKTGPDVWAFRYRDGQVNRKEIIGTVEQFATKSAAKKACESLRVSQHGDKNATHFWPTGGPLSAARIAKQDTLYAGSLRGFLEDVDFAQVAEVQFVRYTCCCRRSLVARFAVGKWDPRKVAQPHASNFQTRDALGILRPQPNRVGAPVC